jgi:hypothetical protein
VRECEAVLAGNMVTHQLARGWAPWVQQPILLRLSAKDVHRKGLRMDGSARGIGLVGYGSCGS